MTIEKLPPEKVLLSWNLPAATVTHLARWFGIPWNQITAKPLLDLTESDLFDIRGIGPVSIRAIRDVLADHGYDLKPEPEITDELMVWESERNRLKRFGLWLRNANSFDPVDVVLHEFLVEEARKR